MLDDDQRRLYELIWKRTVASQMAAALLDRVTADIGSADGVVGLRATGQTVAFDGFLKLYQEGRDDPTGDEDEDGAHAAAAGVGRPAAPAARSRRCSISPSRRRATPRRAWSRSWRSWASAGPAPTPASSRCCRTAPMSGSSRSASCPRTRAGWSTPSWSRSSATGSSTASPPQLEDQLDDVAGGSLYWKEVLREFWEPFAARLAEVGEQRAARGDRRARPCAGAAAVPAARRRRDRPALCPRCGEGRLGLKLSGFGAVRRLLALPGLQLHARLHGRRRRGGEAEAARSDRLLGVDPDNAEEVWLKIGRFGPYVQRGSGAEAKRCSLPPGVTPETARSRDGAEAAGAAARGRASIPRPASRSWPASTATGPTSSSTEVRAARARRRRADHRHEPGDGAAQRAGQGPPRGGRGGAVARARPRIPKDGEPVQLLPGRFGPYVKHGKLNASLPKGA